MNFEWASIYDQSRDWLSANPGGNDKNERQGNSWCGENDNDIDVARRPIEWQDKTWYNQHIYLYIEYIYIYLAICVYMASKKNEFIRLLILN